LRISSDVAVNNSRKLSLSGYLKCLLDEFFQQVLLV